MAHVADSQETECQKDQNAPGHEQGGLGRQPVCESSGDMTGSARVLAFGWLTIGCLLTGGVPTERAELEFPNLKPQRELDPVEHSSARGKA